MKLILFILLLLVNVSSFSQTYLGYTNQNTELIDTNYNIIRDVSKGEALLLLSLDNQFGYYNVIHVKSHKEGFLLRKHVQIEKVVPHGEGNILTTVNKSEIKNPTIKVRNNSKQDMTIKLNNDIIVVSPKEKKTLNINPGKYYYKISFPEMEPFYGEEHFDNYRLYEWEFYIGDM